MRIEIDNALAMPTLHDLFRSAVELGIKTDPRPQKLIDRKLKESKEEYEKLSKEKKLYFDKEQIKNPFSDTRILHGDPKTSVKNLMVGIDVDTSELMLVNHLNTMGKKIDAVMSHHPTGRALGKLHNVMDLQVDVMRTHGVPENIGEKLLSPRQKEVMRSISPLNLYKTVHAAEYLGIPLFCVHTPTDNLAYGYVQNHIDNMSERLYTLGDLKDAILEIPEFAEAEKMGIGPYFVIGSKKSRLGKVAVTEFTGGTGGPKEIYEKLADAGVGTIVSMHISDVNRKEAQKHNLNVLVSGHMPSDSLGINLLMDEFEKDGVTVLPFSGFIRYSRNKKKK